MKKFITLFLVFSILVLSGNMYAKERIGAELIVQKTDGWQIRGELIAVKQNSLLLMDSETSADVSVDIKEINWIKTEKKSKALRGVTGGILGAAGGALLGGLVGLGVASQNPEVDIAEGGGGGYFIIGVLVGGIVGGIVLGTSVGKAKKIQIEGKSDSEIQEILEKLRKKARIRNSQ